MTAVRVPLEGKPWSRKHKRLSQFVTNGSVTLSFFSTSVKGFWRLSQEAHAHIVTTHHVKACECHITSRHPASRQGMSHQITSSDITSRHTFNTKSSYVTSNHKLRRIMSRQITILRMPINTTARHVSARHDMSRHVRRLHRP